MTHEIAAMFNTYPHDKFAQHYPLWSMFVHGAEPASQAQFDAMSFEQRIDAMERAFGDEPMTAPPSRFPLCEDRAVERFFFSEYGVFFIVKVDRPTCSPFYDLMFGAIPPDALFATPYTLFDALELVRMDGISEITDLGDMDEASFYDLLTWFKSYGYCDAYRIAIDKRINAWGEINL